MKQAALIYALTLAIFFYPVLQGKVLYFSDNLTFFWPLKQISSQILKTGKLPIWNPYQFSGSPLLADASTGALSPFMAIYLFLPTQIAITTSTLMALFITGLGMYSLLKLLKLDHSEAIVGGLVWMVSGSLLERTSNVVIIETIAFLPWILFFAQNAFNERNKTSIILSGIFVALSIYSGYLPFVGIFMLILFSRFRKLSIIIPITLIGLGLGAVQLVPFIEYFFKSTRASIAPVANQTNIIEIPRLFFSKIYGTQNEGDSWGPNAPPETGFASTDGYVGILGMILIAIGMPILKKNERFWLMVAGTSLIVSFIGIPLPLFKHIQPYQFLVTYTFASSILVAKSLSFFLEKKSTVPMTLFIASVFSAVVGVLLINLPYSPTKTNVIKKAISSNLTIVAVLTTGLLVIQNLHRQKTSLKISLIGIFIFADLFLLSRGSLFFAPTSLFDLRNPSIDYLVNHLGNFRMLSYAGTSPYSDLDPLFNQLWVRGSFGESNMNSDDNHNLKVIKDKAEELPPNLTSIFHLRTVNGYSGLISKQYAQSWESQSLYKILIPISDQEKLSNASVKFLLARTTTTLPPFWKPVFNHNNLIVYENKQARPIQNAGNESNYLPLSVKIGLLISLLTAAIIAIQANFRSSVKIH